MQAIHVVHFSSMSFSISAHQNMLRSASIFVDPGCPKCSASTICFFNLSGTTTLSPANRKPNDSVSLVKTGKNPSILLLISEANFQW